MSDICTSYQLQSEINLQRPITSFKTDDSKTQPVMAVFGQSLSEE